MIWWCAAWAWAQEPERPEEPPSSEPVAIVDDGTLVNRLVEATPFSLAEAHPYRHTDTPRRITEGTVLVLQVAPWTQAPRQVGVPLLWVGGQLAVRVGWDPSGCAVVWVPGQPDLASDLVFFGTTELPERMGSDHRRRQRAAAYAAGIAPRPEAERKAARRAPQAFQDFRALHAWASARSCGSESR